jgi:hypothetical protein
MDEKRRDLKCTPGASYDSLANKQFPLRKYLNEYLVFFKTTIMLVDLKLMTFIKFISLESLQLYTVTIYLLQKIKFHL